MSGRKDRCAVRGKFRWFSKLSSNDNGFQLAGDALAWLAIAASAGFVYSVPAVGVGVANLLGQHESTSSSELLARRVAHLAVILSLPQLSRTPRAHSAESTSTGLVARQTDSDKAPNSSQLR